MANSTSTYLFVEKKSSEISPVWKSVHILLYMLTAIVSMMLIDSIGTVWSQFSIVFSNSNCVLNWKLLFNSNETSCQIDSLHMSASNTDCNAHFVVYLFLFCASVIILTNFIFLNNFGTHSAEAQMISSWRIVWIATLINVIGFIVSLVDAKSISKSVHALCRSFPDAKLSHSFPCSTNCLIFNNTDLSFLSTSFNILAIMPWVSVLLWAMSLAWCIIRMLCHPDFTVYRIEDKHTKVTDNLPSSSERMDETLLSDSDRVSLERYLREEMEMTLDLEE